MESEIVRLTTTVALSNSGRRERPDPKVHSVAHGERTPAALLRVHRDAARSRGHADLRLRDAPPEIIGEIGPVPTTRSISRRASSTVGAHRRRHHRDLAEHGERILGLPKEPYCGEILAWSDCATSHFDLKKSLGRCCVSVRESRDDGLDPVRIEAIDVANGRRCADVVGDDPAVVVLGMPAELEVVDRLLDAHSPGSLSLLSMRRWGGC